MDWSGDRSVDYRVDLIDSDGDVIAADLPVDGGSLRGDLSAASMWGGRLSATGALPDVADLTAAFVRIVMMLDGDPHPLRWYRVTATPSTITAGVASWELEVIDPTIILARDLLVDDLAIPRGTQVDVWLRARVAGLGLRLTVDDTPDTTRTDLFFDAGTSWLEVCNKVLASAVREPLRVTRDGVMQSLDWRDPVTVGAAWRFEAGAASIIGDGLKLDPDHLAIPNRVVVQARGDGEAPPIRGVWEDRDPASPWRPDSGVDGRRRGWVTVLVRDADVTSAAAATRLAEREGRTRQVAAITLTVTHAWVPVDLGDIVELAVDDPRLDGRYQILAMDLTLDTGLVSARWARIGDLT